MTHKIPTLPRLTMGYTSNALRKLSTRLLVGCGFAVLAVAMATGQQLVAKSHPVDNPQSPLMLAGAWVPSDPQTIDFAALPHVPSQHVVVSDVRAENGVNQHNYLAHHGGKLWVMWSDGPGREDRVGQRVKFATSTDGLIWSQPAFFAP